jgi:hypothetical protein
MMPAFETADGMSPAIIRQFLLQLFLQDEQGNVSRFAVREGTLQHLHREIDQNLPDPVKLHQRIVAQCPAGVDDCLARLHRLIEFSIMDTDVNVKAQ